MAERLWSDTQLRAGFALFSLVQSTGVCTGMHPFTALTAFVNCTSHVAQVLDIEGSLRLFHEQLCTKMGYDYHKIILESDEEACRSGSA